MTAPEPQVSASDPELPTEPVEESPPPEPWTPERVLEWNRYYDIYVAAGALLLILIASIHPVSSSSFWTDIQTGRLIAGSGPVGQDPFSYTMSGSRWVDIPWLFQLGQAKLFELGSRFSSADDPDQGGATAAILVNALIRALTALVLLQIRLRGPGAWWVAICVILGFGAILRPFPGGTNSLILPILGGIAGPATLDSSSWGIFLLAVEMLLLVQASRGSRTALIALVPLFLLWANLDETFLFGLMLLAISAIASPLDRRPREDSNRRVAPAWWFGILVAAAAATLANPWTYEIYAPAASTYLSLFQGSELLTFDRLSFFGPESWRFFDSELGAEGAYRLYVAYYLVVVGLGVTSFVLNRRRFSLSRFLLFAFSAVLWGALLNLAPLFAVVFVATLALNGQEWYQDQFGREGRLGAGWAVWSVGGRAVTLIVIFALVFKGLTGAWGSTAEPVFGVSANTDEFAFEAAEVLGEAPIEGNILNVRLAQGDALIWKAWPLNRLRKTFIDSRSNLFPRRLRLELQELQRALADDNRAVWEPILDRYNITVVMVPMVGDPFGTRPMYTGLSQSDHWIPFHDDGSVVLFGRADAPAGDLAYFEANRLEPSLLAFRVERDVPSSDRTPAPTTWMDTIFRNQVRRLPQPHVWSAQRWLTTRRENPQVPPDLANCLLAVGQARAALAQDPEDPAAWGVLGEAYRQLALQESEILRQADATQVPSDYLQFRLKQRLSVLNFAIQSTPPPRTQDARNALATAHRELAEIYLNMGYFDLARDQLIAARELAGTEATDESLEVTIAQLDDQLAQLENQLSDLTAQQANPLQLADYALQQGAPGIAIRQLDEAESFGINPDAVKAQLVDLYCQIGRPDKAIEIVSSGNVEDPALNTGPGTASYRQGLVYFLIGSYDLAATLWRDRSLPQLRGTTVVETLDATRNLIRGLPRESTDMLMEVPGRLATEANWETQLGLCLLEAGKPKEAAERFLAALAVQEDLPVAPLLRAYLEKIGVPAPDAPEVSPAPDSTEATPGDVSAPTDPATTQPEPIGTEAFADDKPGS